MINDVVSSVSSVYQLLYGDCTSRFCTWSSLLHLVHYIPLSALSFETNLQITSMQKLNVSCLSQLLHIIIILIALLETAISSVSNWMSAHFLTLNPFKTEFLIIGLPQQLSKLSFPTISQPNNVTLSSVDSARNVGVNLDRNCPLCSNRSTHRFQLVLNSAARVVTRTPKFHHIYPILKSLHWLKINQRIQSN